MVKGRSSFGISHQSVLQPRIMAKVSPVSGIFIMLVSMTGAASRV
jgi:hypothetical protein